MADITRIDTTIVRRLVAMAKSDWDAGELSWDFVGSQILGTVGSNELLVDLVAQDHSNRKAKQVEALRLEVELFTTAGLAVTESRDADVWVERSTESLMRDLVSYAVGCMLGRYSLDKPGLILANQGNTLEDYLAQVPTPSFMPDTDNVIPIVDGDWFEDDIVARFRHFLRVAFGEEHFEENLRFVTESLGGKDVRDYFVKSFYDDHVKRYKRRPIYWLFRSPGGSFSALVYLHRYSPSTVSIVLTGYLREFIGKLEAVLDHQGRIAAGMGGGSARDITIAQKEADRLRKVLVELRDYEHHILFPLAGQQIPVDIGDGVLVNYQKLGAALKDIGLKKAASDD
jgi:hypothetical protein